MHWVYILRCRNGALYVGSTPNLERRIAEHQEGLGSIYTSARRPVELVFAQETRSLEEASRMEHQVKGWRRAKKLALMRGDDDALVELSRSHQEPVAPKDHTRTPVPELVEGWCSEPTKSR